VPVHAHHRFDGGAISPSSLRRRAPVAGCVSANWSSVGDEQNRVSVVLQARMGSGKVRLGQFDQLIFVCSDNSFAAWAVQVCLHVATFPFAFRSPIWARPSRPHLFLVLFV
jgi:hypothetical protein